MLTKIRLRRLHLDHIFLKRGCGNWCLLGMIEIHFKSVLNISRVLTIFLICLLVINTLLVDHDQDSIRFIIITIYLIIFHRKEGKVTIERTLPHTITDWVGYTTCISPVHGLGIAPPTTITAFQLFFLDYSLPYSIKRGEIMRFKVSLFNYMHHSLPVSASL